MKAHLCLTGSVLRCRKFEVTVTGVKSTVGAKELHLLVALVCGQISSYQGFVKSHGFEDMYF